MRKLLDTDLEIIHKTPSQTTRNIDALAQRNQNRLHVIVEIARSHGIEEDVLQQLFLKFKRLRETELGDSHGNITTGCGPRVLEVVEENRDPVCSFVEPRRARISGWADIPAAVCGAVGVARVDAGGVERVVLVVEAEVDALVWSEVEGGGVGVVGVEVGGPFDALLFAGGEGAQELRDVGFDARGVVAG